MSEIETKSPTRGWEWDDDAEAAFVGWFNSWSSPYTFLSEYFYGDCKIEDEKTREDMLYSWLHLAFVTGYMYAKPTSSTHDSSS
jgi:hypothetical protein